MPKYPHMAILKQMGFIGSAPLFRHELMLQNVCLVQRLFIQLFQ